MNDFILKAFSDSAAVKQQFARVHAARIALVADLMVTRFPRRAQSPALRQRRQRHGRRTYRSGVCRPLQTRAQAVAGHRPRYGHRRHHLHRQRLRFRRTLRPTGAGPWPEGRHRHRHQHQRQFAERVEGCRGRPRMWPDHHRLDRRHRRQTRRLSSIIRSSSPPRSRRASRKAISRSAMSCANS